METIKSYTDLEQSKKLAEILPIESADMFLAMNGTLPVMSKYIDDGLVTADETAIPCWSLASLLELLKQYCDRFETTVRINKNYNIFASRDGFTYRSFDEYPGGISNLIDACVAMIGHLHKLKML